MQIADVLVRRAAPVAFAAVALAGCGAADRREEITETRQLAEPRQEQTVAADTRMRMTPPGSMGAGASPHGDMPPAAAPGGAPSAPLLAFDLPEGWKEIPAAEFRSPNFAIPARAKLECYVTVLPGGGGGLAANINRWRQQMGLGAASDADIAALPRVTFLGGDAPYVELAGTFKGAADMVMLAVAAERGGAVVTAKLVAPAADAKAEADRFRAMCESLRPAAPGAAPGAAASGGGDGPAELAWKAPEGWTQVPRSGMRLVTFTPDGRPGTECYVTILPGKAGGIEANVNLWRQSHRLAPLSAEAVAALPTVDVLGRKASFVEVDGGAGGLYGLICELGERSVFVKMAGPMESLRPERERFVEFCKSLRQP